MVSIDDLKALLSSSGLEMVDAAARVVGSDVKPSERAEAVRTARPADLENLKEDWRWVAPELDRLHADLDGYWRRALDSWHGPAATNFAAYMPNLVDLIGAEHQVISKFPDHLEKMRQAVEDAKIAQDRQNEATADAIFFIVIGAAGGAIIGILTGGTASAAAVGAAVGAIVAACATWAVHIDGIQNTRDDQLRAINRELEDLVESVKEINVKEVGTPTIVTPGFSFSQFWDQHQPPQVPREGG